MPSDEQDRRFAGRIAVVTGGNRGIGLETARLLARGGARLSLWARDEAALESASRELGAIAEIQTLAVDIGSEAEVRAAAEKTLSHYDHIDILVNNAGIIGPRAPVGEYPLAGFEEVLRVNLVGAFLCCSAFAPVMARAGYGRIVNVASVAGKDGNPFVSGYVASKAGLIGFTKSLGKELAETGVLVNAVTPSASPTDIFGEMTEARKQALLANVPMKRFVEPGEIAELICWLSSDACSFSTGAVFDISGGRATW